MDKRKPRLRTVRRAPAIDVASAGAREATRVTPESDSAAALIAIKASIEEASGLAVLLMIKARIEGFTGSPQEASREQLEAFATFILKTSARLPSAVSMANILAESVLAIKERAGFTSAPTLSQPSPTTTGG